EILLNSEIDSLDINQIILAHSCKSIEAIIVGKNKVEFSKVDEGMDT
ncbi:16655_t:CDS:2, partial [Cetraspora pellucida]